MQLKKRSNSPVPDKKTEYKKEQEVDWNLYRVDFDSLLPYGKYKTMTLEWVRANDDWYWTWMNDNDIIASWGLIKLKVAVPVKKVPYFVTDLGEKLVSIRAIEETCKPCPSEWYICLIDE